MIRVAPNVTNGIILAAALAVATIAGCAGERTSPQGAVEAGDLAVPIPDTATDYQGPLAQECPFNILCGSVPILDGGECEQGHVLNDNGECECWCGYTDDDGWCVFTGCDVGDGLGGGGYGGGSNDGRGPGGNPGEEGDDEEGDDTVNFKVKLTCPASVTRDGIVECSANPSNAKGQNVTYEWSFMPSGKVQVWDHGSHRITLPKVTAINNSPTWSGRAAFGGQVIVKATRSPDTAKAASGPVSFKVTPRTWRLSQQGFARGPDLTTRFLPGLNAHLGANTNTSGSQRSDDILQGSATTTSIMSGPNKGYAYVEMQNYYINRQWRINERLTRNGPREIRVKDANGNTVYLNHWKYLDSIAGGNPQPVRTGVQAHESFGQNGGSGHQRQIEKAINTSTCKDASGIVERIVTASVNDASDLVRDVEQEADKAFGYSTWHNYVHGNYTGDIVLYNPIDTVAPIIHNRSDGATSPLPWSPKSGCRWTGF